MEPSHILKITFIFCLKTDKLQRMKFQSEFRNSRQAFFYLRLIICDIFLSKMEGKLLVSEIKCKLKMKCVLFPSLINGSQMQGCKTLILQLKLIGLSSNCLFNLISGWRVQLCLLILE